MAHLRFAAAAALTLLGCGGVSAEEGEKPKSPFVEDELVCDAGYADCDGDPDNGCEADLSSGVDCGECGRNCGAAACVSGQCSDVVPEDVLTDVSGYALAVVGDYLYWASYASFYGTDGIERFDPATGAQETVAEVDGRVIAIGSDSAYLEVTDVNLSSQIVRTDFVDGATNSVATQHRAGDAALAGDYLFWVADPYLMANDAPYFVHAMPVTGGAGTSIAEAKATTVVATDGVVCWDNLYSDGVACARHDGTPVGEWTAQDGASSLAVDTHAVYWCDGAGLARAPLDGGEVETFGDSRCRRIAPDGDTVYYLAHSTVTRLTLDTGQSEPLASVSEPYNFGGLAPLGEYVYWVDGGRNTISRAPK